MVDFKIVTAPAVILLLGVSALPALAQSNWIEVGSTEAGTVYSVDASSIKVKSAVPYSRPFKVVTIWTQGDHSKDSTESSRSSKALLAFDCAGQRMALLSEVNYNARGSVIDSYSDTTDTEYDYDPVVPETVGETFMLFACYDQ